MLAQVASKIGRAPPESCPDGVYDGGPVEACADREPPRDLRYGAA